MCLKVDENSKRLVAESDIICYKIVELCHLSRRGKDIDYILRTFYRETPIKIGSTYKSGLDNADQYGSIEKGLHTFTTLKSALNIIKGFTYNVLVVKCVIPKGSEYYEGMFVKAFVGKWGSYASTALKYVEILPVKFEYNRFNEISEAICV